MAMSRSEESSPSSSSRRKVSKTLSPAYFTDDIWFEILPYLPLFLIFKFRCVSKVWNFHLSSPDFIHRWIQSRNNTTLPWMLIYFFKQNSYRKFSLAYPDSHSQFICNHSGFSYEFLNPISDSSYHTLYFLGSSNGLVLCFRNTLHCVCNPLTQKWVELPPTPHQYDMERLATLTGFACDCSTLPTSYKVVRIPPWETDSNKFDIQVFSSHSGKWSFYEVFCPDGVTLRFHDGAFNGFPTDGVIIHNNVLYCMDWYNRILIYNLQNNESHIRQCRFIDLPDNRGIMSTYWLGESRGVILYARIKTREETLSVWVLQEENLHLLHNNIDLHHLFAQVDIKLSENLDGIRWGHELIEVLGFSPVDSDVVMIGYQNYIWAYNIGTRKYDELCHPTFPGNGHSDIVYLPLVVKPTILPPRSW